MVGTAQDVDHKSMLMDSMAAKKMMISDDMMMSARKEMMAKDPARLQSTMMHQMSGVMMKPDIKKK